MHRQVQVLADLLTFGHGVQKLPGAVLGVAAHKPDAKITGNGIYHPQKRRKAARLRQPLAVGINVLPQQGDIPAAIVHQVFHLAHDVRGHTAALTPAHVRDNTVGTKIIAAVHDRHKGLKTAVVLHRNLLVQGGIGAVFHGVPPDAAPPLDENTVEKLRQAPRGIAAHHKVHIGVAHFQLFADLLLLGHAAGQGNNKVGLLLFEALERPHIAEYPLLGVFPDGAGIVEDQVGLPDVIGKAVAQLRQHALEPFPVINALLAPEGMNMGQRRGFVMPSKVFLYCFGSALLLAKRPVILYRFFGQAQMAVHPFYDNIPPYIVS